MPDLTPGFPTVRTVQFSPRGKVHQVASTLDPEDDMLFTVCGEWVGGARI